MSTVQNALAAQSLAAFNGSIGVLIVSKGQSWQDRQRIQYEALKGLIYKDFHGLQDFYEQMTIYSATNPLILGKAWKVIEPIVPRNRNILQTLEDSESLGLVGQYLLTLEGFADTFVLPNEILEDPSSLSSELGL